MDFRGLAEPVKLYADEDLVQSLRFFDPRNDFSHQDLEIRWQKALDGFDLNRIDTNQKQNECGNMCSYSVNALRPYMLSARLN